jgi:hypothetical protein
MGRPSSYSEEVAEEILLEIATTDKGLDKICESDSFPESRTVYRWILANQEFSQRYARARELQTQLLADQIIPIADTPQMGVKTKETEDGFETVTGDMIEHRKLQIDARKWLLAKLAPKKYGDASLIKLGGDPNGVPIQSEHRIVFVDPDK